MGPYCVLAPFRAQGGPRPPFLAEKVLRAARAIETQSSQPVVPRHLREAREAHCGLVILPRWRALASSEGVWPPQRCSGSPLQRLGAGRPLIVVNMTVDVASPVSGCSAIPTARTPLFKGSSEVYQLSAVPIDLGFEFMELFKLGLASPHGGGHCGTLSRGPCG
jgi:hypothetical protein